jgi:hypothetical protein
LGGFSPSAATNQWRSHRSCARSHDESSARPP